MPTLTSAAARGFVGTVATVGPSQEVDSVRELNRLLESALRMGGGGGWGSSGNGTPPSSGAVGVADDAPDRRMTGGKGRSNLSSSDAASWRLDTARRLSSLLSSQSQSCNVVNDNLLIAAVRRQSRYWIPLLLSWLKGGVCGESPDGSDNNSMSDLPLTNKQRRHQRLKNSAPSSPPEVQIEALRALKALTEWTARAPSPAPGTGSYQSYVGQLGRRSANSDGGGAVAQHGGVTAGCSPHTPLPASSQRLLLRHADAVPMIVSLLSSPDASVHEQAVWILGSLASGGLGGGILPPSPSAAAAAEVTRMMSENSGEGGTDLSVAMPAVAARATASNGSLVAAINLAAEDLDSALPRESSRGKKDSVSARDVIFASGAVGPLLRCLGNNPDNVSLHRVGAWCLSSMVEGRYSSSSSSSSSDNKDSALSLSTKKQQPSAAEEIDILALLPAMRRMLHIDDAEVLTYVCWTLSHLCDGPAYHIAAVIYSETGYLPSSGPRHRVMSPANGLVPRLVELLLHPSPKVAKPALRTIGNIVCADCSADQTDIHGNHLPVVDFTEIILECHAVPCLRRLIGHHNREIQKESCWTLSNIAAGTSSQIQAVIDSGAIPPLVDLVNDDLTDKEVRSEACWVVLNATSCGNDDQISVLIEEGCVSVLGVLLTEPNMVMMALEGIERVLQTEEAQDSEDLYHRSEEELGQRPTIIRCAGLIKTVTESPHNSSAVSKRARRIWDHHFVSCALCHNNYSRCRLRDSRFCNECKCHVCSRCDCSVYHLSYQEGLWAEDEERAAESKKNKRSKKAKKKQKAKEKAEKKRLESQAQQQQQQQQRQQQSEKADDLKKDLLPEARGNRKITESKNESISKAQILMEGKKEGKGTTRKTTSSSPSRGTIESDSASSGGADANRGRNNENGRGGVVDESGEPNSSNSQPPIDLVLYLQQTGSIIALAKLMDSLYDNEYEEQEDVDSGRQNVDLNHLALTTQ